MRGIKKKYIVYSLSQYSVQALTYVGIIPIIVFVLRPTDIIRYYLNRGGQTKASIKQFFLLHDGFACPILCINISDALLKQCTSPSATALIINR